jgi:outer membrane protein TolC
MIEFVTSKEQYEYNLANEKATSEALRIILEQYKAGDVDFGRVFVAQANLVQAQDSLVANRASIALALINTYRSLGGGWELRCGNASAQLEIVKSPLLESPVIETPIEEPRIRPINAELLEQ